MTNKTIITLLLMLFCTFQSVGAQTSRGGNDVMTHRPNGTYVVNTTTLATDVKGFKGATPLLVYIKSGKVIKVEALTNHESPNFFGKVKQYLLAKWNGMKAAKAATTEVDGVTGATFSSKAVKENVKRGVNYYMKHRK